MLKSLNRYFMVWAREYNFLGKSRICLFYLLTAADFFFKNIFSQIYQNDNSFFVSVSVHNLWFKYKLVRSIAYIKKTYLFRTLSFCLIIIVPLIVINWIKTFSYLHFFSCSVFRDILIIDDYKHFAFIKIGNTHRSLCIGLTVSLKDPSLNIWTIYANNWFLTITKLFIHTRPTIHLSNP